MCDYEDYTNTRQRPTSRDNVISVPSAYSVEMEAPSDVSTSLAKGESRNARCLSYLLHLLVGIAINHSS